MLFGLCGLPAIAADKVTPEFHIGDHFRALMVSRPILEESKDDSPAVFQLKDYDCRLFAAQRTHHNNIVLFSPKRLSCNNMVFDISGSIASVKLSMLDIPEYPETVSIEFQITRDIVFSAKESTP